jgi:hypothetical protein
LFGWSVTDCEQAALIGEGALRVVYDSHINRTGPMIFSTLAQVQLRKNVATVPADDQGRQFFAFGTGAPQRAMTEQELINWANGNYNIR